jgi:hypothetical protein
MKGDCRKDINAAKYRVMKIIRRIIFDKSGSFKRHVIFFSNPSNIPSGVLKTQKVFKIVEVRVRMFVKYLSYKIDL